MKTPVSVFPLPGRCLSFVLALLLVAVGAGLSGPSAHAADGVVTGTVNNAGTGNLLEGARVEIPALRLVALADNTGRYVLSGVPAGTHEVVASYLGLDAARSSVVVGAGQRAVRDFDLTSGIYKLQEFKVTGEREGGAAAITMQRNADNVKNVVAMDSFGNLPNMSAGELAVRLPGVAGQLDEEGNVTGIIVRGMPSTSNRVTVDGGLISNVGGMNRQFQTHSLTGAMFEQLEVIKGHTPDKGADSLGGTVNLKTRSPLSMKEKRRVTYSATTRWAPPFTQQIPLREAHRMHPLVNVAYQEVFGVFGGDRNLGVSVNAFSSENVAGYFRTIRDFQDTTNEPAYVWDFSNLDAFNNRKQASMNVKADYRFSPTTKFSFNTIVNDANEPFNRMYNTRAFTGSATVVPNATTSGVIPGFTNRITTVRPVAASVIDVSNTRGSFFNRTRQFDFGGEHDLNRFKVDYNATYSRTHNNLGSGKGGSLTNRITGIGWTLDRTESDLYPRFIQTAGPDIANPANYRPNGFMTTRNDDRDIDIRNLRGNVSYQLPTEVKIQLKTGGEWREQRVQEVSRARRWTYTGTTALTPDPTIVTWSSLKGGPRIPQWETHSFINEETPKDPTVWREDLYFRAQSGYTGTRAVAETVTAGYVMAHAKAGRTGLLTGVRREKTDTESWGWIRARSASSAAQQLADPIGSANRDYAGTRRETEGTYTKSFPSAHLTHDITSNLKARLSWSTSFGRPQMTNALPNETVNEAQQTLTISNPSLLPQTANNWDASLEYYFEPVGNFSVAWFHKTIKDYIVNGREVGTVASGTNNGFNGDYVGLRMLGSLNAGTAYVQGWEFSYQQQFTFLPGLLKGLSFSANYTALETHGMFTGTTNLGTGQVAGFIPKTANVSLSWRHRGCSTRLLVNHTGDYISAYTAASVGRNAYRFERTIVNLGLAYQFTPKLNVSLDVSNLFNEPVSFYRGIPDQVERWIYTGTTLTLGVTGRF